MSILAIQSGQAIYGATSAQKKTNQVIESSYSRTASSDSVEISDAAKAMAETASTKETPLDPTKHLLHVPQWHLDLLPAHAKPVVGEIRIPTEEERQYARRPGAAMREQKFLADMELASEYAGKVQRYFMEEGQKLVPPSESFCDKIRDNKEYSDTIQQAVQSRLNADSRAVDLSIYLKSIGQLEYTL